jgi:hypothetical protein
MAASNSVPDFNDMKCSNKIHGSVVNQVYDYQ